MTKVVAGRLLAAALSLAIALPATAQDRRGSELRVGCPPASGETAAPSEAEQALANRRAVVASLIGGIAGAVAGNRLGKGDARVVTTIAGAMLGAVVAQQLVLDKDDGAPADSLSGTQGRPKCASASPGQAFPDSGFADDGNHMDSPWRPWSPSESRTVIF